ncbi:MAG TPA: MAPEG family protein [Allosphingosinicella sp.]|jgi:hypothetical protein|uniref:MAPEG family protein n=1 Tax=Allosphingosinicella sp. TaxID=2823234 RepID=UPI002F273F07
MDNKVSPLLAPVVALVIWTLIIQIWMYATRLPAMKRKGISLKGRVGGKPGILDGVVEDHVQWKAHNYNHLLEQPTLFYAVAISMVLLHGHGDSVTNIVLAWAYVVFRIAHSLVQVTVNVILYRFVLFNLASIVLLGLAIHAAIHAF